MFNESMADAKKRRVDSQARECTPIICPFVPTNISSHVSQCTSPDKSVRIESWVDGVSVVKTLHTCGLNHATFNLAWHHHWKNQIRITMSCAHNWVIPWPRLWQMVARNDLWMVVLMWLWHSLMWEPDRYSVSTWALGMSFAAAQSLAPGHWFPSHFTFTPLVMYHHHPLITMCFLQSYHLLSLHVIRGSYYP